MSLVLLQSYNNKNRDNYSHQANNISRQKCHHLSVHADIESYAIQGKAPKESDIYTFWQ